jgi:3-(methylthio)propionyl---CoA ligase
MLGLMQNYPLLIPKLLEYAEQYHVKTEIVSRRVEGDIHRYTYSDLGIRARKLANALTKLGIKPGDIVGTLAWNGYRHLELYFALPGIQAVYHTINPRLAPDQLAYIINHADDKYIFVEAMFVPLLEDIADELSTLKGFVILCDREHMPETSLPSVICYEELVESENDSYMWGEFDENTACGLCYTSGTTGNPRGVVYSHRALVLQALNMVGALELTCRDTILPIVPMFHVNGWTLPFVSTLLGNKLVMPGKDLDGASVYQLLNEEKVTFSAGVPTVWLMLLNYLQKYELALPFLKKILIGGSAAPLSMLETFSKNYDVEPMQGWGMTETSSMGTGPSITAGVLQGGDSAVLNARLKQGRAIFGIEMKIINDNGNILPRDGKSQGHLCIRGWAVANSYFKLNDRASFLDDGWFETGDIATIDGDGYMQLTDRSKDMIKSGGEWISSINLENAAMGHTDIAEAAVIAIDHPKWGERPLLIIVPNEVTPDKDNILAFLGDKVPRWWLPDDIVFVDSLPHGPTGKVEKKVLREKFRDFKFQVNR